MEKAMKAIRAVQNSVDVSTLSIPDAEEIIEEALNELAFSSDPGLARALHFLAPPGYQAIVELCSENGRSKRRNSFAESWSPEEDEVRIYFERIGDGEAAPRTTRSPRPASTISAMTKMTARKPRSQPISTPASRSCAPPWPKPKEAAMPLSPSSGSAIRFFPARPFAGIRIPNRARQCWLR